MELKEELIGFLRWYDAELNEDELTGTVEDYLEYGKPINSSSSEARTLPTNEDKEKKCHHEYVYVDECTFNGSCKECPEWY